MAEEEVHCMRGLNGKRVIVTGGGSGIGRAVCQRFGEEGAEVAVAEGRVAVDLVEPLPHDVLSDDDNDTTTTTEAKQQRQQQQRRPRGAASHTMP